MRPRAAPVLVAIAAVLAGCGGSGAAHRPAGEALFAQACSACHSLSGRESARRQGGDLLAARFSRAVLLQFASEMPVRHSLSPAGFRAVTDYVLSVQRHSR